MKLRRQRMGPLLALVLALLLGLILPSATAADGVVHLYYFFDPGCAVCHQVHEEIIVPLLKEYGSQLLIDERDMSDQATFEYLLALESQFKVTEPGIPEVFIGTDALIGDQPIRAQLRERVEFYLGQGGVALPELAGQALPTKVPTFPLATRTPEPAGAPANGTNDAIWLKVIGPAWWSGLSRYIGGDPSSCCLLYTSPSPRDS